MSRHGDGFSYPSFDMEKCIRCGSCSEVCLNTGGQNIQENRGESSSGNRFEQQFFAFRADDAIRMKSTSGGAFAALAGELLPEAIIYAVTMDERHKVLYDALKKPEDISRFAKTCYVEAEAGDAFASVTELLSKDRPVVFVGNPCKVEGLLSFLGGTRPMLTTIDHICNGVPSPGAWEKYIEKLEGEGPVSDYKFRAKERPDSAHCVTYVQNGKQHCALFNEDPWSVDYSKGIGLRNACYSCKYARAERVSDLTLGDFWGIEKSHPEFDDGYGVSLLIANTEKGQRLVQRILEHGRGFSVTREEAMQPRLLTPPAGRAGRKDF